MGITLRGCKSQLSPPTVSGRKGGYCRNPGLWGEAILEERCGHGWAGYVCSTGIQRHSRASSASSKVSGNVRKRPLLALGQLATGRSFLNVIYQ